MGEPDAADPLGGDDLPAFSVSAAAHEMTAGRTGAAVGRFRGGLVIGALLAAFVCTVTVYAFLLALTRQEPGVLWTTVVMIAGSVLSLVALYALGASVADEFHRTTAGVWICVVVFGAALFFAGWWLLFGTDLIEDETAGAALPYVIEPTVVGGVAAAAGVVGLVVTVRRAHRDARTPAASPRSPGTIVSVPAPSEWEDGNPRFTDVMVAYPDRGAEQTLAVTMRTTADRVPVEGSPVIVERDADGRLHVHRDPDRPMVFDAETAEYEDPGAAPG